MMNLKSISGFLLLIVASFLFTKCGVALGLFYKDWRSEVAYRSSSSKKDYFIIEGITQSHCGCSDLVIRNYKNKKLDFTFYYGGGLFPAKKYAYRYNAEEKKTDTIIYIPVATDNYSVQFDSLDKEILRHADTLIATRPRGSGLIYKVKRHEYKGFVPQ